MREVHHIALSVTDLEASRRFYGEAVGLRETLNTHVEGAEIEASLQLRPGMTGEVAYFQGPSQLGQIELIQWRPHTDKPTLPKRPGDPGVFLLSIAVSKEELDEVWQRMQRMDVPVFSAPSRSVLENYGPIDVFIVEDPDGVMIEFVALPTREEIKAFRTTGRDGAS